jgi:hypothetical protein
MKHINEIFDNLDLWRHLPAYQLERRADIFFSIYLPDILYHKFGVNIEGIIPEFPIRLGTIDNNAATNQSIKVDYLAKVKGKDTIIFVELKTDQGSLRDRQDWCLERAKQVGFIEILDGVRKIYQATNSKKKYQHLINLLQDMDFIVLDNRGVFQVIQKDYNIQVIYIIPNNPNRIGNVITFHEISEIIERHGDELSLRFSKSLIKWANITAGE